MFTFNKYGIVFYDAPDDGGSPPVTPPVAPTAETIIKQYNSDPTLIAMKHADVLSDNYEYRRKNKTLTDDLAAATTAKETAETSLQAYIELGEPDAIQSQLTDAQAASAKLQSFEREKSINEVATANGLKPSLLKLLAKDLEIVSESVDVDGETKIVTKFKDGDNTTDIKDYFTAQGEGIWESLQATPSPDNSDRISYPTQSVGTKIEPDNPVAAWQARNKAEAEKPNALLTPKVVV